MSIPTLFPVPDTPDRHSPDGRDARRKARHDWDLSRDGEPWDNSDINIALDDFFRDIPYGVTAKKLKRSSHALEEQPRHIIMERHFMDKYVPDFKVRFRWDKKPWREKKEGYVLKQLTNKTAIKNGVSSVAWAEKILGRDAAEFEEKFIQMRNRTLKGMK